MSKVEVGVGEAEVGEPADSETRREIFPTSERMSCVEMVGLRGERGGTY